MAFDFLHYRLQTQAERGLLRSLPKELGLYDFASNDYLGLSQNIALSRKREKERDGLPHGSTGSRLLTGNHAVTTETEEWLAHLFGSESALLVNSGYDANLALLSCIAQRGDTFIYDEKSHASIKDGMRLSLAAHYSFSHNDPNDLSKKIQRAKGNVFVVIESVYSMDGTVARLQDIVETCERHGAHLLVDEAHSTGIYGRGGCGLVAEEGLSERVLARVMTFGKALGMHGAAIAGPEALKEVIINFSRPFIYTTGMAPSHARDLRSAFEFIAENTSLVEGLKENIAAFRELAEPLSLPLLDSSTAIQGLLVPGPERVRKVASALRGDGLGVFPVLPPTVPGGTERIRICLHTFNTKEEISLLIEKMNSHLLKY